MKPRTIEQMQRAKSRIERGAVAPARVLEVRSDGKGGFIRHEVDPVKFQKAQQLAWNKAIPAARRKLGLSQSGFAELLGISIRTLHHWEHGTRRPSGAARVLLRIATENPEVVLKAVA